MDDNELILALLAALSALVRAHGFISDPEGDPVECECRACIDARAVLDAATGGESLNVK